jgi:hypothetical protein
VKIFVSYSRRDAGDFANQIHRHLSSFTHDIFTDVYDIKGGEVWNNTIETNISNCDIFVVIVTFAALRSIEIEREVLQAQKENKIIVPCFHSSIRNSNIKWGLNNIQGVQFDDKFELARNVYSKIFAENYTPSKKIKDEGIAPKQVILTNPKPRTFYGEKRIFVGREKYIDKIKEYLNNSNDPISVIGLGVLEKVHLFSAIHKCEAIFDSIIPIYFSTIGVDFDLFLFLLQRI